MQSRRERGKRGESFTVGWATEREMKGVPRSRKKKRIVLT